MLLLTLLPTLNRFRLFTRLRICLFHELREANTEPLLITHLIPFMVCFFMPLVIILKRKLGKMVKRITWVGVLWREVMALNRLIMATIRRIFKHTFPKHKLDHNHHWPRPPTSANMPTTGYGPQQYVGSASVSPCWLLPIVSPACYSPTNHFLCPISRSRPICIWTQSNSSSNMNFKQEPSPTTYKNFRQLDSQFVRYSYGQSGQQFKNLSIHFSSMSL